VRLRRTIVGATLVAVVAVLGVRLWRGEDTAAPAAAAPAPVVSRTALAPTRVVPAPETAEATEDGGPADEPAGLEEPDVPQNGTGSTHVVAVPAVANHASGRTVRYTVEVEGGLGVDEAQVAATVQGILLDERGWQGVDHVRFVNVSPERARAGGQVDIRVTLASPGLTDRLCAPMRTMSQVSCWNGERSVLNFRRWALGDDSYGADVARYRVYQVNHEVGHGLGHQHEQCAAQGARAPVMVQQTLGLGGCKPWPYPSGA
jgi:pyruvate/2-oxoglutarate dehydrogenase complex dihydrolipoamide acyltransferase (E2) component